MVVLILGYALILVSYHSLEDSIFFWQQQWWSMWEEKKASCTNTPFGKGQKYVGYYYSGATRQRAFKGHIEGPK